MKRLILSLFLIGPVTGAADTLAPLPPLPEADARQWPAIGRIFDPNNPDRGFCSGTLVAPDVVLTAGHCAGGTVSDQPDAQSLFLAGAFNSETAATRRITARLRHPTYLSTGDHAPEFDIGLWRLSSPIENITPLPLGTAQSDTFALLGYHRMIPFRLSGRMDCPLKDLRPGLIEVGCRVISGNSGSPLLQTRADGGVEVVAVTSSQNGANAITVRIGTWLRETLAGLTSN